MRILITAAVLLLSTSSVPAVQLSPGNIDPHNEMRAVAIETLEVLGKPGARTFALEDPTSLKHASLAPPFIQYWTDASFDAFESPSTENILRYVGKYCLSFPVILDGRVLGTIDVVEENGTYRMASVHTGGEQATMVNSALQSLKLAAGERLSILTTSIAGNYLVIENGAAILQMALIGPVRSVDSTSVVDRKLVFLPASQFYEPIRKSIGKYRKEASTNKLDTESWRTLDD